SRGHNYLADARSGIHCAFKAGSPIEGAEMAGKTKVDGGRQGQSGGLVLNVSDSVKNIGIEECRFHDNQICFRRHSDIAVGKPAMACSRTVAGRNSGHMRSMALGVLLQTVAGIDLLFGAFVTVSKPGGVRSVFSLIPDIENTAFSGAILEIGMLEVD